MKIEDLHKVCFNISSHKNLISCTMTNLMLPYAISLYFAGLLSIVSERSQTWGGGRAEFSGKTHH